MDHLKLSLVKYNKRRSDGVVSIVTSHQGAGFESMQSLHWFCPEAPPTVQTHAANQANLTDESKFAVSVFVSLFVLAMQQIGRMSRD